MIIKLNDILLDTRIVELNSKDKFIVTLFCLMFKVSASVQFSRPERKKKIVTEYPDHSDIVTAFWAAHVTGGLTRLFLNLITKYLQNNA